MLLVTLDLLANILFKIFTSVHGRDWSENYDVFFGLFFLAVTCGTWDLGSPSKGRTCAPCSGSAESQPLDHQGNPYLLGFGMRFMLVS